MKITIESTTQLVDVNGSPARVWQGTTEGGVVVSALVVAIAVDIKPGDPRGDEIARGLHECVPPLPVVTDMFPPHGIILGVSVLCLECGQRNHIGPCGDVQKPS